MKVHLNQTQCFFFSGYVFALPGRDPQGRRIIFCRAKSLDPSRKYSHLPIIDVIDDKTLEYYHGNGNYFQIGGFTWSGHFNWIDVPDHEKKRRQSSTDPLRTPTMAGGLFAVNRHTFWELGSYDEEMDVWGGENLEMSFR